VNGAGLAGLAGIAGIRLPAGGAEQTITPELYPEVLKSQDFRMSVADVPLFFSSLNRSATAVEYFGEIRKPPVTELIIRYTVGLPAQLLAALRPSGVAPRPVDADSTPPPLATYDRNYLRIVNSLGERLVITIDRKTSVITINGTMPDAYAAADLVRVTSSRLMEEIIKYESRKAGEQFVFVSEHYAQAKVRYEKAQRELALFADQNRSLMSAVSRINQERLQREYDLSFEMYQQFSRELEQARMKMNQDTPVFTVLERVSVPTDRASPKRVRIVLFSIFLGCFVGVLVIWVRQILSQVTPVSDAVLAEEVMPQQ
jgi:capsular polysaccharide biosynthesis protein